MISLDVEMFWGVTKSRTFENYGENILNEFESVRRTMQLFKKYNVIGTWCVVGFMLERNKESLQKYLPASRPAYTEPKDHTYSFLENLKKEDEKYFFDAQIRELLKEENKQEVGSHSFSHYYSNQCKDSSIFRDDVAANDKIFQDTFHSNPTSYIFPRNQVNDEHLQVLKSYNYTCYRGNDKNDYYSSNSIRNRVTRLLDSYINITGRHTHSYLKLETEPLVNIPASFILRPFSKHKSLNMLQKRRLKKAMEHAAKKKELFHLWWHPHNLGKDLDENFTFLEDILKQYKELNEKYNFKSYSMSQLAQIIQQQKQN